MIQTTIYIIDDKKMANSIFYCEKIRSVDYALSTHLFSSRFYNYCIVELLYFKILIMLELSIASLKGSVFHCITGAGNDQ